MAARDLLSLVSFLVVCCSFVNASIKKGVCINPHEFLCGDLAAFDNIYWWYDWSANFDLLKKNSPSCDFQPYVGKYVPMMWGYNANWFNEYKDFFFEENSDNYVLGFNEPNHLEQSGLTAQEAVDVWPLFESFANGSKTVVSPAAANCGSNCVTANTADWFNAFFNILCDTTTNTPCRMQYLATHHYPQYKDGKPNSCSATKTMNFLEDLYERYNLKIWLTEFACARTTSVDIQLKYMKELLPLLEESDIVFRYAWYVSRSKAADTAWVTSSADLLNSDNSAFTVIGEYYNNFVGSSEPTTTSSSTTSTTTTSTTTTSTTSTSATTTSTTPTTSSTTTSSTTSSTTPAESTPTSRTTTEDQGSGARHILMGIIPLSCAICSLMLKYSLS